MLVDREKCCWCCWRCRRQKKEAGKGDDNCMEWTNETESKNASKKKRPQESHALWEALTQATSPPSVLLSHESPVTFETLFRRNVQKAQTDKRDQSVAKRRNKTLKWNKKKLDSFKHRGFFLSDCFRFFRGRVRGKCHKSLEIASSLGLDYPSPTTPSCSCQHQTPFSLIRESLSGKLFSFRHQNTRNNRVRVSAEMCESSNEPFRASSCSRVFLETMRVVRALPKTEFSLSSFEKGCAPGHDRLPKQLCMWNSSEFMMREGRCFCTRRISVYDHRRHCSHDPFCVLSIKPSVHSTAVHAESDNILADAHEHESKCLISLFFHVN